MSEIEIPGLPAFPTTWSEEEEKRLKGLEEQKTHMEELFQTKFSPEAWAKVSAPERIFRGWLAETAFQQPIKAISPWKWGFDYGVTPEQARIKQIEVEAEYQELLRMQRVISTLPMIQKTLRALALSKQLKVTTKEELDKYFKLGQIGFTEEETSYVVEFARSLLQSTPEQLASGEDLGLHPITADEIATLFGGTQPILHPNQLLSTVAFSKDIDQIQSALQMAYPPKGGELGATTAKERLLADWVEQLKGLGVEPKEGESLADTAARAFEGVGQGMGWAIPTDDAGAPLLDPATGDPIVYNIDDKSYVWHGEDVIGFYDTEGDRMVPLDLQGNPIYTEEQKEKAITDIFQTIAIELGFNLPYMGAQFLLNAVPMGIATVARAPFAEWPGGVAGTVTGRFTPEQKMLLEPIEGEPTAADIAGLGLTTHDPFDRRLIDLRWNFEKEYFAREERYITQMKDFYTENPNWLPREEWSEPMIDRWNRDPRSLFDAGYLGYQMASNIHTYLAIAASLAVTFATKNPYAGMATAATLFVPMETESLRQDLIASGATYNQATDLAIPGGILISSMECIGNIPVLKAFAPSFFSAVRKDVSRSIASQLFKYGIVAPGKIIVAETFFEEVPQEILHNAYVQAIDKNRHLLENVPEVILQSLLTIAPIAFGGGGSEYLHMKNNLNHQVLEALNQDSLTLQALGVPKEQADLQAYNKLTSTEKGRAAVDVAVLEARRETPWEPGDLVSKIAALEETKLTTIQDIKDTTKALVEREARLAKDEELGKPKEDIALQKEIVTYLQDQLAELEVKRVELIEIVDHLKLEQANVGEGVVLPPEVTETPPEERGTPMPPEAQQGLLVQAEALMQQLEEVKPNSLYVFGIPEGEALIRTDAQGSVLMFVTLHMRKGKLTLDTIVSAQPDKILNGRALLSVITHLKDKDIAFPPKAEMSKEAIKLYDKLVAMKAEQLKVERKPSVPIVWEEVTFGKNIPEAKVTIIQRVANLAASVFDRKINLTKFRIDHRLKRNVFGELTAPTGVITYSSEASVDVATTLHELAHAYSYTYIIGEEVEDFSFIESFMEALGISPEIIVAHRTEYSNQKKHRESKAPDAPDSTHRNNSYINSHGGLSRFRIHPEEKYANMFSAYVSRNMEIFEDKPATVLAWFQEHFPMSEEATTTEDHLEKTPTEDRKVRLPRKVNWKEDEEKVELASKIHPELTEKIRLTKNIREARDRAEKAWGEANEDARMLIAKKLKLGKSFISKDWASMSGWEKGLLTINAIPDSSIHFNMLKEAADMEEFCEYLEEAVGLPFLSVYRRATEGKSVGDATAEYIIQAISKEPKFKKLLRSDAQKAIVSQELNARNEIQGIEHPENITEEQLALVDAIQEIYESYKSRARYMSFMRAKPTLEALKERFPYAVKDGKEAELVMALTLRKMGQTDALWQFLQGCTWGVVEKGYDPRQISSPDLRTGEITVGTVRGSSSLELRTKVEFPEGRLRRDVLARMIAYVNQMEIQWNIEPELHNFEKMWDLAYWKFTNKEEVKSVLNRWWGKMQGIPSQYGFFGKIAKRVWRQAMTSIFWEPVLSLRNSFQALNLHMDRTELIRTLLRPHEMSLRSRVLGKRYFDIFVSQLGGLRQYMLLVGQPGIPGLGKLNQLADSLNIYGWSDYIPRFWSFKSYLNKATRATDQYLKDGNINKWIKNSGALHLRNTERNYAISHFLARKNDLFNLQVDGLEDITGAEMVAFYVAQRNTDRTHFKYRRELRGGVEMGVMGETLFNLFVFPRGYGQRVYFQAEKIGDLFKGEATWTEARSGFNDLIKLFIAAQIFSGLWKGLTGRKRNPYDPMNILTQWTFGGLFVGSMIELTKLIGDSATAITPWGDPLLREQAQGRLPGELSDLSEMLVPFYRRIIDIWAAFEDTPDQDVHWLRQMKKLWDDTYTEDELEKLDMSLWEKMKKAVLGAEPTDPDILDKAQVKMQESRDMLGTRDIIGKYYTVVNHATVMASLTREFPDIFTSEYSGSHDLDIFFKDCEAQWEEYYTLPSSPSSFREQWRIEHPEEEAMMLFWGKFSSSKAPIGSPVSLEIASLLLYWFNLYGITQEMHPYWANWELDLTKEPRV